MRWHVYLLHGVNILSIKPDGYNQYIVMRLLKIEPAAKSQNHGTRAILAPTHCICNTHLSVRLKATLRLLQ